jgi:hypothetical protein
MEKPTRREILLRGIKIVSAVALLPVAGRVHAAEPACVEIESEPLRESLGYADPSPNPRETCSNCGFFRPNGNASCGDCDIMSGPTNGTAWCESWSPPSG